MCRVSTPPSNSDTEGPEGQGGSVQAVRRGDRSDKVCCCLLPNNPGIQGAKRAWF